MDPANQPAVNPTGDASVTPAAPATDVTTTAQVDSTPVNTSTEVTDNDFDDIDEANPLTVADLESESEEDDDDENKVVPPTQQPVAPKEGETPVVPPTETATPSAVQPETPTVTTPAKESRVDQLSREIAELRANIGVEPNADIRSLVAEKNLLQEINSTQIRKAAIDVERKLLDMTNPDTGEAYTPDEAHYIASRAAVEAQAEQETTRAYELGVQRNQTVIRTETQKALTDFPMFDKDSPQYDKDAADLAGQYLQDAFVIEETGKKDKDGNPVTQVVNIRRSPYQIMKSVAETAARYKSQSEAQRETDKAEAEAAAATAIAQQANGADVPISGNTTVARKDTTGEDFDEAFDEYDS